MYAITMPRCTIGYTLREFMQNLFSNWEELKKILQGIYLHSGRTDANGGHRDWLNRTGWGFGAYHYHHKLPAHLHPNGKCPYGNKKSSRIINPYTGKNIDIGVPYIFENDQFYSLDLVVKSLTADDNQNIILKENESGGVFFVCSTGDSTKENPGTVIFFDYSNFLGFLDNRVFETLNGNLRLLASSDGDSTKIYISLETIRDYMTKDGYFTDFSDNGSGVWSFKVRKPIVHIITPQKDALFKVGYEVTVQANIENVASARLIVGKVGPIRYTDGFEERRYNLENQSSVTFSKFKLTEDEIGSAAIESGRLTISVNGHTGGTALDAEIDARMLGDSVSIRIEKSEESGNGGKYFVTTNTNLTVREEHSTISKEVAKFSPGERFTIFLPKDTYNDGSITWIKVNLGDNKMGWVAENYVLPDEPIETLFPESIYGKVTGNFSGTIKTENYIEKWGSPGKGLYIGANQKLNGRYKVAVAPKILNPRYSDDGQIWMDELKAFNKNITVVVKNMNTEKLEEIECVVTNLKAHSYNKYPDGHGYTLGGTGSVNVENGFIQTGIAYPKSTNAGKDLACSKDHMNGNIVEFCSEEITDFSCEDYKILKIVSNQEGHN